VDTRPGGISVDDGVPADTVATLRTDLLDSDPQIWPEIEVPVALPLRLLHAVVRTDVGREAAYLSVLSCWFPALSGFFTDTLVGEKLEDSTIYGKIRVEHVGEMSMVFTITSLLAAGSDHWQPDLIV